MHAIAPNSTTVQLCQKNGLPRLHLCPVHHRIMSKSGHWKKHLTETAL